MIIRNKSRLEKYSQKHTIIKDSLQRWINIVEEANWKSHNELKLDFPSADYIGNGRYVFNIQGNNYRVLAIVVFIGKYLNIRFIGTHSEYNKIDCKNI